MCFLWHENFGSLPEGELIFLHKTPELSFFCKSWYERGVGYIQHMFLIEIILPEGQPIFYNWIFSWCKLQFRNLLNTRVLQENLMLLYTKKLWFPELAPTEHVIKQWHLKQPTVKKSQLEKFVNIVQRIVQCRISIQFNVELEIKSNENNKISSTKFDKSKNCRNYIFFIFYL